MQYQQVQPDRGQVLRKTRFNQRIPNTRLMIYSLLLPVVSSPICA